MSSHHIVREKQEPALYIHKLANFDEEYLGQLLEWSPTLLVHGSEYEKILSLGLKVDIIINPSDQAHIQENSKLIDTEADGIVGVVDFLISEKYPAVNIISDVNGIAQLERFVSSIDIVLFTEFYKSYPVKTGFSVWKAKDSIFRLEAASDIKAINLNILDNGDYQVVSDGFVEFTFSSSYLFISELL
ncbi:MAG: thiamine pyrophosphokinase [Bacteroidota bacterium]